MNLMIWKPKKVSNDHYTHLVNIKLQDKFIQHAVQNAFDIYFQLGKCKTMALGVSDLKELKK